MSESTSSPAIAQLNTARVRGVAMNRPMTVPNYARQQAKRGENAGDQRSLAHHVAVCGREGYE